MDLSQAWESATPIKSVSLDDEWNNAKPLTQPKKQSITDLLSQLGTDITSGASRTLDTIKAQDSIPSNVSIPSRPDNFQEFIKPDAQPYQEEPSIFSKVYEGAKHLASLPSNLAQETLSQHPTKTLDKALGGVGTSVAKLYEMIGQASTPAINSITGTDNNFMNNTVNPFLEQRRKEAEKYIEGSTAGEVGAMATEPMNALFLGEGGPLAKAFQGGLAGSLMTGRDYALNNETPNLSDVASSAILMGGLSGGHALLSGKPKPNQPTETRPRTEGMTPEETTIAQNLAKEFDNARPIEEPSPTQPTNPLESPRQTEVKPHEQGYTVDEAMDIIRNHDRGGEEQAQLYKQQMEQWAKSENIRRAESGQESVTPDDMSRSFGLQYENKARPNEAELNTLFETITDNDGNIKTMEQRNKSHGWQDVTTNDQYGNPYTTRMAGGRGLESEFTTDTKTLKKLKEQGYDALSDSERAMVDRDIDTIRNHPDFRDENQALADRGELFQFVRAQDNEQGAFSDMQTKQVMREIDDSGAKIRKGIPREDELKIQEIDNKIAEVYKQKEEILSNNKSLTDEQKYRIDTNLKNIVTSLEMSKPRVYHNGTYLDIIKGGYGKLYDVLDHDALYEKYPKLKDAIVEFDDTLKGDNAWYDGDRNVIGISNDLRKSSESTQIKVISHEIQHWIQEKEKMPRGGNLQEFTPLVKNWSETISRNAWYKEMKRNIEKYKGADYSAIESKIIQEYYAEGVQDWLPSREARDWVHQNFYNKAEIAKLLEDSKIIDSATPKKEKQLYAKLYGEQQARATEYRKDMTPEQRAKESWQQTLERVEGKYEDPIIKYGNELYQSPTKDIKGAYSIDDILIKLSKSHDVSTLSHELGHRFLYTLSNAERAIAERVFGVKDGKWTVANHEAFADAYARFIAEGKAPKGLKGILEKFKAFTKQILLKLKENNGGKMPELSKEAKEFFKATLGDKEARAKLMESYKAKDAKAESVNGGVGGELYQTDKGVDKFFQDLESFKSKNGSLNNYDYSMMDISDRDRTRLQRAKNVIDTIKSDPEDAKYTYSDFNEFSELYRDQFKYAGIRPQVSGNKVKIFRSATGEIEAGDWVGLDKAYANSHGRTSNHKLYEMWVDKEDIRWQGDDANEWIYLPKKIIDRAIDKNVLFQRDNSRLMEWHKDSSPETKNADGTPKVFYHGTRAEKNFNVFNTENSPSWFTPNKVYAGAFTKVGGKIFETYLHVKKPMWVGDIDGIINETSLKRLSDNSGVPIDKLKEIKDNIKAHNIFNITNSKEFSDIAKSMGYDGLEAVEGRTTTIGVFEPTQIKSINNKGTFDENNPNILYQIPQNLLAPDQRPKLGDDATKFKQGYAKLKEAIGNGVNSFKDLTPQFFKDLTSDRFTAIAKLQDRAELLHKALIKLSPETNKILQQALVGDIKALPQGYQTFQPLVDAIHAEMRTMTRELVRRGMLDAETAKAYGDNYLKRSYEKHWGKKSGDVQSGDDKGIKPIIARGKEVVTESPDDVLAFVEDYLDSNNKNALPANLMDISDIKDDLTQRGLIGDSIVDGKMTWEEENGRIKLRRDWTKAERESMGEIENASLSVPNTILSMGMMLHNAKLMSDLAPYSQKFRNIDEAKAHGYDQIPNTPRYGELAGLYMDKEVVDNIKYTFERQGELKQLYAKSLSIWKQGKTVFNPTSHFNNFIGNITTQFMLGRTTKEAFAMMGESAKMLKEFPTKIAKYEDMKVRNVIGMLTAKEQAEFTQLKSDLKYYIEGKENGLFGRGQIVDILKGFDPISNSFGNKGIATRSIEAVQKAYQRGDDIPRLASYKVLRESGMPAKEAKEFVTALYPDYSKPLPKGVRFLRDSGLSPFISWSYYVLPNLWKLVKQHPARATALLSTIYIGSYLVSGINPFGDDIPDKEQGRRIPISKDGTTLKIDRMIAGSDFGAIPMDIISKIAQGANKGDTLGGVNNAVNATGRNVGKLAQSYLYGGVPQLVGDVVTNKNSYTGRPISGDTDSSAKGAYNYLKYIGGFLAPAPMANVGGIIENEINPKLKKQHSDVVPRTNTQELLKQFGLNTQTYDTNEVRRKRMLEDRKTLK